MSTLAAGARIGPYEIVAPLGAGGMGEVLRARDTKLGREVAIKVLPAAFAGDAERVARFRREAQILAVLNHPNVAAIHGLEETEDQLALVMELVEGEDLAERLKRGAIPVDESVAIAKQIAAALEEAHERGIVHRDLKPANVKVTAEGKVKVLDFGLAKAFAADPMASSGSHDLSQSPTLATAAGTQAGIILGTAAYMSPEQARGKAVDKRADIWAFGVVLFEMLAGQRLFHGETVSDVLAAVLTREVGWSALPADTPLAVTRLLKRCLERDPKQRLRDIGEARVALEGREPAPVATAPGAASARPALIGRALPWAIAVAAGLATLAVLRSPRDAATPRLVTYLDVGFPPEIEPLTTVEHAFGLSPDGRALSITGVRHGIRHLFVRHLGNAETLEIPGSEGATCATFSPDSRSVAFVSSGRGLSAVSLVDHERTVIAQQADIAGGLAWGTRGVVYGRNGALWLAPAGGGPPRALTTLDAARSEVVHSGQHFLPDGRTLLFASLSSVPGSDRIEAISVEGGARTVIVDGATTPIWSPTGHLLFARGGAVLATAFDLEGLRTVGSASPVLPAGLLNTSSNGGAHLRLSDTGALLYAPHDAQGKRLVSVGRAGAALTLAPPRGPYLNPRLSVDGRRILFETANLRLEAFDRARATHARLTPDTPGTSFPIWMRDGRRIVSRRFNLPAWISADGGGEQGQVPATTTNDFPSGPGPDADSALLTRITPDTSGDIVLVSISGKFAPRPLVSGKAYEGGAQLSPDLRWIVYVSTESGQAEIRLRRFPALDGNWLVSEGVGVQPRWSPSGREIFYRDGASMMSVPVDGSGTDPVLGRPIALFRDAYDLGQGLTIANYDLTPDGRFVMLRRDSPGVSLRLVQNWTIELEQALARGGTK